MGILDRVTEHYESLGKGRMEVPEWGEGGKSLIVTWTPLTVAQHRKIYPANKEPDAATAVSTLILKALDEAGKPLFTEEDRIPLMTKADNRVVVRVATMIVSGLGSAAVREAEKN